MPVKIYHRKNSAVQSRRLRRCLEELLAYAGRGEAALEISLVGRARMRFLNLTHRGKDYVTDVLSFPLDAKKPKSGLPWHLGEVVIFTEMARSQARQARRTLTSQVLRLAVHGFVHLHGLDHEKGGQEAERFHSLEAQYLRHLHRKELMPWDGSLQL